MAATKFSDQKPQKSAALRHPSPSINEKSRSISPARNSEERFYNVRRQLEHEFVAEQNQKLLAEQLDLDDSKPKLRQNDAVSVLSHLFESKKENIINLMKEVVLCWRETERVKGQLVDEHLDFNLVDAFEALDKGRKGFVTTLDLVECLEDIKILDMPGYC